MESTPRETHCFSLLDEMEMCSKGKQRKFTSFFPCEALSVDFLSIPDVANFPGASKIIRVFKVGA